MQRQLDALKQNLTNLDFDVVTPFPYENFTALRAQVDKLIQGLGTNP